MVCYFKNKGIFLWITFCGLTLLMVSCSDHRQEQNWTLEPFIKQDGINPCLVNSGELTFYCPVRNELVFWEEKDVFNPAAVVRGDKIYLLYRAEDSIGKFNGTSRIGIAESLDGKTFIKHPHPVLYPDNDFMKAYEWEGGCEDPRVVEDENGIYYMTYTTYDGKTARLCVATSNDLFQWEKRGLAFGNAYEGKYRDTWSKSGSIVCTLENSRLIATKINGRYWMYWGDTNIFIATSDNLIDWYPLEMENGELAHAFGPRKNYFDSELVEPGPPALLREDGILLIYNSKNNSNTGDATLPNGTYAAGQALLNPANPGQLLNRTEHYFFYPEREYEITGQVNNVCFLEGLVYFNNRWFLYYGTADSKIAVAICNI